MTNKTLALIGAQLGWGAQQHATEWGPKALADFGITEYLKKAGIQADWQHQLKPSIPYELDGPELNAMQKRDIILAFNQRLADILDETLLRTHFPVILGGDHAIAMGTWSGVVDSLKAYQNFGLIWIDAHLDAHIPSTTPSGAIHGMPVAHLLGHGDKAFAQIRNDNPKLLPKHIVFLGIRSFEEEELEFIRQYNIKVYNMDVIDKMGFAEAMADALAFLNNLVDHIGVTIDLDAIDPCDAPGVGSPEENGLRASVVLKALRGVGAHPKIRALEIAEYNPQLDINNKTKKLIVDMLQSFFIN